MFWGTGGEQKQNKVSTQKQNKVSTSHAGNAKRRKPKHSFMFILVFMILNRVYSHP